ncbi:RNA methyltransferase [cf. Phormidesmis sp. LEGE 11477]|uniref:RNA methyltransferase n=1 Tax=cf. Phormidesmis sp. LEGE 11477 TaxID=1828680 RepID=UPI00187EC745|nr:RNA methyltransferase [cf. Phormidesmis sp. LEGE 11477]MBE9062053.1 RNA methyltransferase [cf. Phormidesmis sp. LEGE 11477]
MSEGLKQEENTQVALAKVRIVLVAPAGPLNVGSVARVMKNFGLSQLYLVDPQCDYLGAEALQMAVHADDVLAAARIVGTIPEALVGCEYAIATTARPRGFDAQLDPPEIALPNLLISEAREQGIKRAKEQRRRNTALIFGPEDRGLSNQELTYAQQFLKISTSDAYSALNLAQAVTICCYELSRLSQSFSASLPLPFSSTDRLSEKTPALQNPPSSAKQSESVLSSTVETHTLEQSEDKPRANLEEIESYYEHLESLLLRVGYLHPHTSASRMRKLRQLLHRASPTSHEVALLRGMIRQTEWALSHSKQRQT